MANPELSAALIAPHLTDPGRFVRFITCCACDICITRRYPPLARNLSAEKSDRQGEKRRLRNKMIKTRARTLAKDFVVLVEGKKKDEAKKVLGELASFLDKAVTKGVYHRNTAARKKSRMNHLLSGLKA